MDTEKDTNNHHNNNIIEYYKENIVIDFLKELCTSATSPLSEALKSKLNLLFADIDLSQYVSLHKINDLDHRSSNILGLGPVKMPELSYNEQKELQSELEKYIIYKCPRMVSKIDSSTDKMIHKLAQQAECKQLTSEQNKLIELSVKYHEDLKSSMALTFEMWQLMNEWLDIRMGVTINTAEDAIQLFKAKNKILELKTKITNIQHLQLIYGQYEGTVKAYMEIHKDIASRLDMVKSEILACRKIIEKD